MVPAFVLARMTAAQLFVSDALDIRVRGSCLRRTRNAITHHVAAVARAASLLLSRRIGSADRRTIRSEGSRPRGDGVHGLCGRAAETKKTTSSRGIRIEPR
jgi:hypothetical protein